MNLCFFLQKTVDDILDIYSQECPRKLSEVIMNPNLASFSYGVFNLIFQLKIGRLFTIESNICNLIPYFTNSIIII